MSWDALRRSAGGRTDPTTAASTAQQTATKFPDSVHAAERGRKTGVLARPEAELRRQSNGKESWVFRAAHPSQLLGVHAGQVGQVLRPGEVLHYVLYSPMWEGSGGPFGIRAEPASHAVVVTDSRFMISRDQHSDAVPPTLLSIPFEAVLCVESGSALMLGWLVIRYAEEGSPRAATLLYRALGRAHFAAALRSYRSVSQVDGLVVQSRPARWQGVWDQIGERYREEIEPLLTDFESPISTVAWPALYGRRRKRSRESLVCTAPAGALVVSTHGLFSIGDDPQALPRSPNFGVNALFVPPDALQAVTLADKTASGSFVLALQLRIGRHGAAVPVEVLFPGERLHEVEHALGALAEHPVSKDIAWSL